MFNPVDHNEWYTISEIPYWLDIAQTWLETYTTRLYELFREYPFVLKVAIISIIISIIAILGNLITIRRKSRKDHKAERIQKKLFKKYHEALEYIISEDSPKLMSRDDIIRKLNGKDEENEDEDLEASYGNIEGASFKPDKEPEAEKFENPLRKEIEKMAFARIMYALKLHVNASERRNENIAVICDLFDLPTFLEKKVNTGKNFERVECLRIMWALRIPVNVWMANSIMNTKHKYLRKMLTYASMSTSANSPLDYFSSEFFEQECCKYDEIQLGYILQKRRNASDQTVPDLLHWINIHESPQAKVIFIRLMRKFKMKDEDTRNNACSALVELFHNTTDHTLLKEIINTWGFLKYEPAEELMYGIYFLQTDDIKVAIMRAIQRISSGNFMNIFIETFTNRGSDPVRLEALRCMYNYGKEGQEKLAELEAHTTKRDRMLFWFFHNSMTKDELYIRQDDIDNELYENNMFSVQ